MDYELSSNSKSLIVVGGGAAGFFCAVNAARMNPDLKVLILEKSGKLLSKVKVSGGGRCNVTHACFKIAEMAKRYPRGANFVKKTFHRFFTTDTIEWFESRGVQLKTEMDGRMFPISDSSQSIIKCLLQEAAKYKVEIKLHIDVKQIKQREKCFDIIVNNGQVMTADYLCIATGGAPKLQMFDWLTAIGHTIAGPVPSLFTFNLKTGLGNNEKHPITALMGLSVDEVSIKIAGTTLLQQGSVLVTHWGLSGPCVLKLSAWGARILAEKSWQFLIIVNWLPAYNEHSITEALKGYRFSLASQKIYHKNPFALPKRLWEFLLQQIQVKEETRWADLPAKQQSLLAKFLVSWEADVNGKTTFKEEFVTAGGINLSEIDANTMMSKKVSNLYFAGEVIDVDGITGGYNFQNAWSTGWVAAKSMANS
ncbi:MAG: NAD(P)/FAD-dependent oxidoreductase [Niabella sp.]